MESATTAEMHNRVRRPAHRFPRLWEGVRIVTERLSAKTSYGASARVEPRLLRRKPRMLGAMMFNPAARDAHLGRDQVALERAGCRS